jgi:hypothetical protein
MTLRRITLLLAVALLAIPLAACGDKEKVITHGDTEGVYLSVGNLRYQVQISRELNPADPEDRGYLIDIPGADQIAPNEAWFGVFMGAWNYSDDPGEAASSFEIKDTQGNVYTPVAIGPQNVFAWRPQVVEPGETLPIQDTAAANNPSVNGGLVLFKIKMESFNNRPLEFSIHGPEGAEPAEASVDLDV